MKKTFSLTETTVHRLKELSIKKNASQSNVVDVAINLLTAYIDKSQKKKPSIVKFTTYRNGKIKTKTIL